MKNTLFLITLFLVSIFANAQNYTVNGNLGIGEVKDFSIILFLGCLFLCGCIYDPSSGQLFIRNNSDQNIYVYSTCEDELPCSPPLKLKHIMVDNAYNSKGEKLGGKSFYPRYRIEKDSIGYLLMWGTPSHPTVYCDDGKIRLYIISENEMKSNDWQFLCKNQQYEKKLEFSQKELDSLNWKITFNEEIVQSQ